MNSKLTPIVEAFKKFSKIPVPLDAIILSEMKPNSFSVQTTWSVHDMKKLQKTSYIRQYVGMKRDDTHYDFFQGFATESSLRSFTSFSKTGKKIAVLLKSEKSSEECQYLEVWSPTKKLSTFVFKNRKEHGKIHENAHFGCLEWSSNEKYLLYVAEAKRPKSESYFSDASPESADDKPSEGLTKLSAASESSGDKPSEGVTKGEEFKYREEWGESIVGAHHPIICILDTENGNIQTLVTPELENISCGSAVWGPLDESIVFVGIAENPRRLSPTYCPNRKTVIYSIDIKTNKIERISGNDNISVDCPRFSPDSSYLVYLENDFGGPHGKTRRLIKYDWASKTRSVLIDVVNSAPAGQFAGLYPNDSFSKRCFSEDGNYFFFSTYRRSKLVLMYLNVENSHLEQVDVDESFGTCNVLDVKNDIIIASVSAPNIEPCLIAGKFDKDKLPISWSYLDTEMPAPISGLNWSIASIKPTNINEKYPDLDYEIIMITTEEKKDNTNLIMFPHGGPHSISPAGFSNYVAAFVELGYAVCLVNYRGSTGFGEDSILSLPGNVGDQDVKDVHNAAEYMKKNCGLQISETVLCGGSHGGFLSAHLIGQYPDYYKAAALLNPVINMVVMADTTDIPDWTWVESAGGTIQFDFKHPASPELQKKMFERSPMKYVKDVKTPTIIFLGKEDLRVPQIQGLSYYHILKANNVPVSVYCYDDNHSLAKTASTGDMFVNLAQWFQKHLSNE